MSTLVFILPFLIVYTIVVVYAERKISAFIQDRYGPMEVGYYGMLQTVADLLKLLQKEDLVSLRAEKWIFKASPLFIFTALLTAFSVIPLGPEWPGAPIYSALYFLLAVVSLDVIGILVAGWSSNNKYSVLGSMRSAVQLMAYEVPLGLSVIAVCVYCQSLDLQEIVQQQGIPGRHGYLLGLPIFGSVTGIGGLAGWNIIQMPVLFFAFVIYFVCSLAECNRAPFDLPEAESELVAGYQTEFSGFRWGILMLSEYAMMLLVSLLGVILFVGGWNTPFPNVGEFKLANWTSGEAGSFAASMWAIFWLIGKALTWVFVQIWVRWTFPRIRYDQLISISWKYFVPGSLLLILITGIWKLLL